MKLLDVTFYRNFHLDLKSMDLTNQELIHQYKEYGSIEGRLSSEAEFYELYSDFDLDFYSRSYQDVSIFNGDKYLLMWHYHNYGFKEGRIANNFDPNFYNNFHLDIKCLGLNDRQLKEIYENYGKKEGRLSSELEFYTLYPEFDYDFYNIFYNDLSVFNGDKYLLMWHYHYYGFKEGRLLYKKTPIPKTIYICSKKLEYIQKTAIIWKNMNPEWEIKLYDDEMCKTFLKDNYSPLFCDIFDFLKDGPIKADFWRVCILYKCGGLYVDSDIEPLVPLNQYIENDDDFVSCLLELNSYNPHFILANKFDYDLKLVIKEYVDLYKSNVEYYFGTYSIVNIFNKKLIYNFSKDDVYFHNNKKYKFLLNNYQDIHYNILTDYKTESQRIQGFINEHNSYKNIRVLNNRFKNYNYIEHKFFDEPNDVCVSNYLINLERRPDRLQIFNNSSPVKNYFLFYGFDGSKEENFSNPIIINKFNNLRKGEIGCFMSHILLYEKIVRENVSYAFIMEDDACFTNNFNEKFNYIIKNLHLIDFLYIGGRFTPDYVMNPKNYTPFLDNIVKHKYVENYHYNNTDLNNYPEDLSFRLDTDRTTHAYIISKEFAQLLLDLFYSSTNRIEIPIDWWIIENLYYSKKNIFSCNPLLCYSEINSDSDIR